MSYHKVGNSTAVVLKKDGNFIQVRILPSAWADYYHVINEDMRGEDMGAAPTKVKNQLMSKSGIIHAYGELQEFAELTGW